jgi:hypothetical protein
MSRTCTICSHEKRAEIEAAIVSGMANRPIASQFGVGYKSVERHASEHIKEAVQQAKAAKEEEYGQSVAEQLAYVNKITREILKRSNDDKKDGMSLLAIDRLTRQIDMQAKLFGTGESDQEQLEEEWLNVREVIFRTLEPFPEARRAVARALLALGRGDGNNDTALSSDQLGQTS